MKRRRIDISDHAMLRYLERVHGIDLGKVRAEISESIRMAELDGDCTGVIAGSMRFVINGGVLVTVHPASRAELKPDQAQRRREPRIRGGARNLTRELWDE